MLFSRRRKITHAIAALVLLGLCRPGGPAEWRPFTPGAAWALSGYGFGPQQYKGALQYGVGVFHAPREFSIYAQPDDEAEPVATFRWDSADRSMTVRNLTTGQAVPANRVFLAFYPGRDIALMAVVSENGDRWAEVTYDQTAGKTGWTRLTESAAESPRGLHAGGQAMGRFQTWLDFMSDNGKTNGIYWLNGVSEYHRSLRYAPEDQSKLAPVSMLRGLKVKHFRGNWMLVEAYDFERNSPIGWIRWRDEDGRLMVFPNLSGMKQSAFGMGF